MDGEVRVVHKMDTVLYQALPKMKPIDDIPNEIDVLEPEIYNLQRIWGKNREFEFYLHEDLSIDQLLEEIFT